MQKFAEIKKHKKEEGKRQRSFARRKEHYLRMGGRLSEFYDKEGITISERSYEESFTGTYLSPDSSMKNLHGTKGLKNNYSYVDLSISNEGDPDRYGLMSGYK